MNTAVTPLTKGSKVIWTKGAGTKRGKISSIYRERIIRTIAGNKIQMKTGETNPAYLIEQDNGESVLKLHDEIHMATSPSSC